MYERSSKSANSPTNSSRCLSFKVCQCRARDRRAISWKSKMSLAIFLTARRRSSALSGPLRAGSSSVFTTRSIAPLSCSVGTPASAAPATSASIPATAMRNSPERIILLSPGRLSPTSHLPEDVLGQELLEVDRGLHFPDPPVGRNQLLRPARADADVALADQPLGLDGGDRIVLELDVGANGHADLRLVFLAQVDRVHAPDLDAGDLDRRAG